MLRPEQGDVSSRIGECWLGGGCQLDCHESVLASYTTSCWSLTASLGCCLLIRGQEYVVACDCGTTHQQSVHYGWMSAVWGQSGQSGLKSVVMSAEYDSVKVMHE